MVEELEKRMMLLEGEIKALRKEVSELKAIAFPGGEEFVRRRICEQVLRGETTFMKAMKEKA